MKKPKIVYLCGRVDRNHPLFGQCLFDAGHDGICVIVPTEDAKRHLPGAGVSYFVQFKKVSRTVIPASMA